MKCITSHDGTTIAYDVFGNGPVLILVNGTMGSRVWGPNRLAQLLKSDFSVYDYDRRGRGDSTDNVHYSVQKEIQDIETLIQTAGGLAYVCGLSSGAALAMQAAVQLGPRKITKLVMYEGPYTVDASIRKRWENYGVSLKMAAQKKDRDTLVVAFLEFMQTPQEEITRMRQDHATWQKLRSLAPTLLYDYAVNGETLLIPVDLAAKMETPTLVVNGGASGPVISADADTLAGYMPHATRAELANESHNVDPESLAPLLVNFFQIK